MDSDAAEVGVGGGGGGAAEGKSEEAVLTVRGLDERVRVVQRRGSGRRSREGKPWRLSVDLPRACVYTVQAGVGYLL